MVTVDGRVLWASEEPELLWALRGGGGGFGGQLEKILPSLHQANISQTVVTAVKMKIHKYPTTSIYAGIIFFPNESLPELAKGAASFTRRENPKMAMHLYCLDLAHAAFTGQDPKPGIMVFVYDANGEAHGRSDEGFGWALKIKGAVDETRTMTYADANRGQGRVIYNLVWCRLTVSKITFARPWA